MLWPEYNMGTAHSRYSMRGIVTAIRHNWAVVCGEILKGLEEVPSPHSPCFKLPWVMCCPVPI
jgi:hypothetical protein